MLRRKKDSIENLHYNKVKQLQQQSNDIPKIQKQIDDKLIILEELNQLDLPDLSMEDSIILAQLKLEIPELRQRLSQIDDGQKMIEYYKRAGKTLSCYHQSLSDKDKDLPSFGELIMNRDQSDSNINSILQNYSFINDPQNNYEHLNLEPQYMCQDCQVKRTDVSSEGIMICPECREADAIVVHSDKPSYNDSPCDNVYFSYKRINHFKEKLCKVQQDQGFKMPEVLVEKLCERFLKIQDPYLKYRPMEKNNFTSYSYVINKLLHILGYPQYAHHFSLLKSKEKLYLADMTWKKICQEMDWIFHPSSG